MTGYKVFIPSAGLGNRLGDISKNINKALVSVNNKPGISHIIDKFPKDIEIVVAVGHLKELLKQYLEHAYPDRKITIVEIENYSGPGSGLGRTILDCEEHLQCPFIFCSNDTIVHQDIPPPSENWMGWDHRDNAEQYRVIQESSGSRVVDIHNKGMTRLPSAYIGLAGIRNYKLFWEFMRSGVNKGSIVEGESYALKRIVGTGAFEVVAKKFTWFDTGNVEELKRTKKTLEEESEINILPKPNEAIWFVNERVIKYAESKDFIANRVHRAGLMDGFVPQVKNASVNMYSYSMIGGRTLSRVITMPLFDKLMEHLKEFWEPQEMNDGFYTACLEFYKTKTYDRLKQYFHRFEEQDRADVINGVEVPPIYEVLEQVDWNLLSLGCPTRIHGDLHFENILVAEDSRFVLLDWRQDFGGMTDCGDIYYDLAKLLHGLIVSHEIINKDMYWIDSDAGEVTFDLFQSYRLNEIRSRFEQFVAANHYDWKKVKILTALIYLNIAPLHHHPYSELLFYLGKEMLYREVTSG